MITSIEKFHTLGRKASFCSLAASSYLNAINLAVFSKIVKRPAKLMSTHDIVDNLAMKLKSMCS